jgi:cation diffusion facilitator CzcD-associated flavoprotein CzcO
MNSDRRPRFAIIGAGMSGLLAAIKLREAGYDFTVFEKEDRVGGTWRENTYPGIACDVPSHLYSYSFELNPDWTYLSSPGGEIQAYFEGVAGRYGIDEAIRFGEPVVRCEWQGQRWEVETGSGFVDQFEWVIAATGILHHPKYPDIEGLEDFAGESFHSARWDHDVPLDGRRIGVVGTGSSGVQITGALAPRAGSYSLFQRTAQWVVPVQQVRYTEEQQAEFRSNPESLKALHDQLDNDFHSGFANQVLDGNNEFFESVRQLCTTHLEEHVSDPALREKLRPDYTPACKRLVISHDFYDSIQAPQAELVTESIQRVEPKGIRTEDGRLHEIDVLVLATGFHVGAFVRPMSIRGLDGLLLDDVWKERPSAYMSVTVPGFPNFFMLNGPNSPVGNFSLIRTAEMQFAYLLRLVDHVNGGSHAYAAPCPEAAARFEEERVEAAKGTVWATGCRSWYLDDRGIPFLWPFPFTRFSEEMEKPRFQDYALG